MADYFHDHEGLEFTLNPGQIILLPTPTNDFLPSISYKFPSSKKEEKPTLQRERFCPVNLETERSDICGFISALMQSKYLQYFVKV